MKLSETPAFLKAFSHIYIENEVAHHRRTQRILDKLPASVTVRCKNYKDIFCRSHQVPELQRQSKALLLAKARPPFLYQGAKVCQSFGNEHFYYTSSVMNCIYDCEYCYLQGMYPTSNLVVFVDLEETFAEVDNLLRVHPVYLCISYDTDLLALESLTGLLSDWFSFAATRPTLTLEVRTKCASVSAFAGLPVLPNVILAYTLSPQEIVERYEHFTPSARSRIQAAKTALSEGRRVRLCFDPMLYVKDFEAYYGALFEECFHEISPDQIEDVSVGIFRISKDYLKNMRQARLCAVTYYPYELTHGVYHYDAKRSEELLSFARRELLTYLPEDKLFFWEDSE